MATKDHPTVVKVREQLAAKENAKTSDPLDASWLRALAMKLGADDVGFVTIGRAELDDQRDDILKHFPHTKTLISFVCRMNREPIRSTARSMANLEFHHVGDRVNEVARGIVHELEEQGVRAVNPAMGFPMEMDEFPGKIWVVSHKPIAVAAGLGEIGIHRNVIHPKFGNFILLGTVLGGAGIFAEGEPVSFNPCLDCKLCVAACPVGAISTDGQFDFSACYTHNYREFMGGFTDWVEDAVDSKNRNEFRQRHSDSESASIWQSLSFGANYKAAYCLSVCPAGEDVIAPYLDSKKTHLKDYVKPLQEKRETIYVMKGVDAEKHVSRRFPQKTVKHVGNSLRPRTVDQFTLGLSLVFQRKKSAGLSAVYHFQFTGMEQRDITVRIHEESIEVSQGHLGQADLKVTTDTKTWFGFLAKERSLVWALLTRRIKLKGSPFWLLKFAKCFPD